MVRNNDRNSDEDHEGVRRATDECWMEASLYRAYPAAIVTGAATLTWLNRGSRAGTNTKLGLAIKTSAASLLAYWGGKLQYLTSKHCRNKFLDYAPDSRIARTIRKNHSIHEEKSSPQPPGRSSDPSSRVSSPTTTISFPSHNQQQVMVQLTPEEQKVLDECASVSFYFYSLPLSALLSACAIYLQSRGHLHPSKWISNPAVSKLPKTLAFGFTGFLLGQWIYIRSGDCQDRFLNRAPKGQLVNLIKQVKRNEIPHIVPDVPIKHAVQNPILDQQLVAPYTDHHKQTEYTIPTSLGPLVETETASVDVILDNARCAAEEE